MSQMKELYEKVSGDAELQKNFQAILAEALAAGKEATEAKLVAFAREAGYSVSLDEMQEFFKELESQQEGELSDLELDLVAGGKVSAGSVLASVFTLGVACAFASAVHAAGREGCGAFFQDNTLGGGGKG